jgi:Tol biopolymer transport system component
VSAGGLLVYTPNNDSDSPLLARGLDITNFRTRGDPVLIAESVTKSNGVWAQHLFSVSSAVLAYASGGDFNAQLTWFDRTGKVLGTLGLPDPTLESAAISPDGSIVAAESAQSGSRDIWLHDVARGPASRFTLNAVGDSATSPAWSPDGKSLLFSQVEGGRSAGVVRKALAGGGRAEPVGLPWGNAPRNVNLIRWSRDGQYVVAALGPAGATGSDIWMVPLSPPGEKARPYLESKANETGPSLSPKSDWLAYVSDDTRRSEVYVRSFPNPGGKVQVSINGGSNPVWSRDGKEIFFIGPGREMMAVAVRKNGGGLEIGTPKALFDSRMATNPNIGSFDVDKDGRFLIPVQQRAGPAPLNLIINWQTGLKK